MWEVMFWPIVACVLLPWLLVYLGLHVVQRGIIFIDIAMAQMASLGICLAVLFHLDLESWTTFGIALGFTLVGRRDFFRDGETDEPNPAGSRHRHFLCCGGGGGSLAAQPRGGRRRGNQKHARWKYSARDTARSLEMLRAFCRCRCFPFRFAAQFPARLV